MTPPVEPKKRAPWWLRRAYFYAVKHKPRLTVEEIASRLDRTEEEVRTGLFPEVAKPKPKPKLSPKPKPEVGTGPPCVICGLPLSKPKKGDTRPPRHKHCGLWHIPGIADRIREMLAEGLTDAQMAARLGWSKAAVSRALMELRAQGVEFPTRHRPPPPRRARTRPRGVCSICGKPLARPNQGHGVREPAHVRCKQQISRQRRATVARMISDGAEVKEVAEVLGTTPSTVRTVISDLRRGGMFLPRKRALLRLNDAGIAAIESALRAPVDAQHERELREAFAQATGEDWMPRVRKRQTQEGSLQARVAEAVRVIDHEPFTTREVADMVGGNARVVQKCMDRLTGKLVTPHRNGDARLTYRRIAKGG